MIVALGIGLMAAGCATPNETVEPARVAQIQRIGVISLIQDKLSATQATGVMVFSNEYHEYPVPEWELQKRVERVIVEALRSETRFEVIPLEYDATALWRDFDVAKSAALVSAFGGDSLFAFLRPVIADKNLDAVVAATPGFTGQFCPDGPPCSGYGTFGFGLIQRRLYMLGPRDFSAYVSVHLDLMDVATGKTLARADVNQHSPLFVLDLAPTLADYDARDRREIENTIRALLDSNISTGLYQMKLLGLR